MLVGRGNKIIGLLSIADAVRDSALSVVDEMRSQGETAQVDWVIAGELQGKSSGWELFLRIVDPNEEQSYKSSLKSDNPYNLAEIAENWVQERPSRKRTGTRRRKCRGNLQASPKNSLH